MTAVLISREAEEDLDEAFLWYELQSTGLGDKFISFIDEGFRHILLHPKGFPVVLKDIRKHVVRKFPFIIYYRINNNLSIEIIRILHNRRRQKLK